MQQLQPITRETSAQQTANQILSMIREGVWKAGDRLPPERELLASLGIGRSTVREALQILSTLNVVHSVHGQGTFIKAPRGGEIFRPELMAFLIHDAGILDLMDTREMLEPRTIELACLRASEAELDEVARLLDDHAASMAAGRSVQEHARLFHTMLASASHNAVAASFIHTILDMLQSRRRPDMPRDLLEAELADHREIFALVRARDAAGASDLLKRHIVQSAVIDVSGTPLP